MLDRCHLTGAADIGTTVRKKPVLSLPNSVSSSPSKSTCASIKTENFPFLSIVFSDGTEVFEVSTPLLARVMDLVKDVKLNE